MKFTLILTWAFLAGLPEAALAGKPLTTSASGKIESLTASGHGSYRVTLQGFARVLRAGSEEPVLACLRKGSEKGEALELAVDLNGNILGCKRAPPR